MTEGLDDFVLGVFVDYGRLPRLGFVFAHGCISNDNHQVARLNQAGCGTVQADNARAGGALNHIGVKAVAVVHVKDAHLFEGEDVCCIHQVAGNSNRPLVIEVCIGNGCAMNFAFE